MDAEKAESLKIKTPEQIEKSRPIPPKGYWWKSFLSAGLWMLSVSSPVFLSFTIFILFSSGFDFLPYFFFGMLLICLMVTIIISENIGPIFSDHLFEGLFYYKKRKIVWNRWWYETWRYKKYLEDKNRYDDEDE